MSHRLHLAFGVACSVLAATSASAQGFDVQQFNPGPVQSTNVLTVSQAQILGAGLWEVGLMLNYADSELVFREADDTILDIVGGQMTANVMGGVGIANRLELGIDIPIILLQSGDVIDVAGVPSADDAGAGLGDIRFVPTILFFDNNTDESPGGAAMSLSVNAWFPTGDDAFFQGDSDFRVEPRLALDIASAGQTRFSVNLGWLIRERQEIANLEVDDTLTWGLGIDIPLNDAQTLHWLTEFSGDVAITADDLAAEEVPVEANLGIRYHAASGLLVQGGGGLGIIKGFGTPTWRAFLGLAFARAEDCDPDEDGVGCEDVEDDCPFSAEDMDGFEDEDGCPDNDNDQDGIPDRRDDCPNDPEDMDGFEDDNGCPDLDNDQDGILDVDDACPNDPEDMDGFEDSDGCPDPDNDQDGILDVDDGCPDIAEDMDGFEDEDGCIDLDNDRDGMLDGDDDCPVDPEDFDGFEDEDGCPEEGSGIVELTCDAIVIGDSVYFATDEDTIETRSFELLDQVAAVLRAASYVRVIRVEGHTDDRGADEYNLDLSTRRAASVVRYLTAAGVDASRLTSEGYGETRPIASNDDRTGRAQNRRVDFIIVEQDSICGEEIISNPGDVGVTPDAAVEEGGE